MRLSLCGALCALWIGVIAACGSGDSDTLSKDGGRFFAGGKTVLQGTVQTGDARSPVAGVTVTVAGVHTVTDDKGHYTLEIDRPDMPAVVLASKRGFFTAARPALPHAGTTAPQDIAMYPADAQLSFAASQGAIVVVNGAVIDIPANAVQSVTGAPYTGTVHIDAGYNGPTTAQGVDAFPQPYQGIDENKTFTLQTAGVVEAQLYDDKGGPLRLARPARLTFPGIGAIDRGAASLPLWYYDAGRAVWLREGQARRQADGSYQSSVTRFAQWTLARPFGEGHGQAELRACVRFANGASTRHGIDVSLTGAGWAFAARPQPLRGEELAFTGVPIDMPLTLRYADAGTGKVTTVPVPPLADGQSLALDCVALVGTDRWAALQPQGPAPVAADAPPSSFEGNYPVAFGGQAASPADMGNLQIDIAWDGRIAGNGTSRLGGASSWDLQIDGQVAAGGYLRFTAVPQPRGKAQHPLGPMVFTGRFITTPHGNFGMQGAWSYGPASQTHLSSAWWSSSYESPQS